MSTKRTRKREFLAQMERVVPWTELETLIAPHAPQGLRGRPPFLVGTMQRIHFMQQWFTLSDPAMERALHDVPLFREFAVLNCETRLPDESTILRFRHLPEENKLAVQTRKVDALLGQLEQIKARIRAKVEHPFRVIKCQFGQLKVHYRGLAKNTAQLTLLIALSSLWMVRCKLLVLDGHVGLEVANAG